MGEMVENPILRVILDPLSLLPDQFSLQQTRIGDIEQPFLGEVANQAWVGTVLNDTRRPWAIPGVLQLPQPPYAASRA